MPAKLISRRIGKQGLLYSIMALLLFSSFHYPYHPSVRINKVESFSQNIWDSCKKEIRKKLDSLSQEFEKNKNIKGKINDRSIDQLWEQYHRISRLKDVLKNLDQLEKKKDQIFSVERITEGEGGTVYDLNNGRIVFRILNSIPVASFVHETTHGGQFESGGIVFRKVKKDPAEKFSGAYGNDYEDEVAAYKAQYSYDPGTVETAHSFEDITTAWVMDQKLNGVFIYAVGSSANIALIPITIRSTKDLLAYAYPRDTILAKFDTSYTLGSDGNYLNYKHKK